MFSQMTPMTASAVLENLWFWKLANSQLLIIKILTTALILIKGTHMNHLQYNFKCTER